MGTLLILLIILAISLAIHSLFVALATVVVKRIWFSSRGYGHIKHSKTKRNNISNANIYIYDEKNKYSSTGWTFNEETQLWEPPKNMK